MATFTALNAYVLSGADPNFTVSGLYGSGTYSCVDADSDTTFEDGDTVVVNGPGSPTVSFEYVGFFDGGWIGVVGGITLLFTNSTYADGATVTADSAAFTVCFLAGTHIATPSGETPVETLAIGDLVLGADGRARLVRWIGRQTVVSVFANPQRNFPIRVTAGALADTVPSRDLLVSPDHALLVDGLLVQAAALVDGVAVRHEPAPAERFTWYHIELEDHALVLAEGAPAETFVDNVTRRRFDNYAEYEALYGADATGIAELELPRVKSARQLPAAVRARLDARAAALGSVARAA
jgi:hypothetical protein